MEATAVRTSTARIRISPFNQDMNGVGYSGFIIIDRSVYGFSGDKEGYVIQGPNGDIDPDDSFYGCLMGVIDTAKTG